MVTGVLFLVPVRFFVSLSLRGRVTQSTVAVFVRSPGFPKPEVSLRPAAVLTLAAP